ncbi:Stp1/IreP family PP2C-type Ser/Thr phosphatase [Halothermothrix orenii]|uniref:Phosphoric monoester hydrolase n=1 Tax=Halothermothrix orenii (strain H 168 / OCM 544 / DSM 9562) TaxID=373903 RepID=B8CWT2_HALOH|nr:Stp1/IreP family PP2C-type Ser/Thr phosphatase [Halothermothrix orenii]ACL69751.1 phosphoric monoester hydrolase [Halothermothrix orenii H 168]
MQYSVFSDKGKVREKNEDNYLIKLNPIPILAVADGLGGHKAGEVASKMAIDFIKEYSFDPEGELLEDLYRGFCELNKKIINSARENTSCQGMGTTLSLGIIWNNILYIGHIGDSRIYLFRENKLKQLTTDHSLVNELLQENKITKEEAYNHPQSHILTQALGTSPDLEVETKKFRLTEKDYLLLCTDGLTDMVPPDDISKVFRNENDVDGISRQLGKLALKRGGVDNITIIVCSIS